MSANPLLSGHSDGTLEDERALQELTERLRPAELRQIYALHPPQIVYILRLRPALTVPAAAGAVGSISCDGEVAEWSKAAVSKTVIPFGYLGFESLPLRHISRFVCIMGGDVYIASSDQLNIDITRMSWCGCCRRLCDQLRDKGKPAQSVGHPPLCIIC